MAAFSGSCCCSSDATLLLTPPSSVIPPSAAASPPPEDEAQDDDLDVELADHHHQYQTCSRRAKRRKRLSLSDGIALSVDCQPPPPSSDADIFDEDDDKLKRKKALQQTYALRSNPKRSRRFLDPDYVALETINGGGGGGGVREDDVAAGVVDGEPSLAEITECEPDSTQQQQQQHQSMTISVDVKKPPSQPAEIASGPASHIVVTNRPPARAARCTECGKQFASWKALFGHMRCHPERQWRGIQPPPNHDKFYADRLPARDYAAGNNAGRRHGAGPGRPMHTAARRQRAVAIATTPDHRDYSSEDPSHYTDTPYAVVGHGEDDYSSESSGTAAAVDVMQLRRLASAAAPNSSDSDTESIEAAYINRQTSSVEQPVQAASPARAPEDGECDETNFRAESSNPGLQHRAALQYTREADEGTDEKTVIRALPDAGKLMTATAQPRDPDDVKTRPAQNYKSNNRSSIVDEERDMADCALVMLAFAAYKSKPTAEGQEQPSCRQRMVFNQLDFSGKGKQAAAEYGTMTASGGVTAAKRKSKTRKSKQAGGAGIYETDFSGNFGKSSSAHQSGSQGCFTPSAASNNRAPHAETAAALHTYGDIRRDEHTDFTASSRFQCSTCKKTFRSHQALGGHRASHKRVKGCFARTNSGSLDGTDQSDQLNNVEMIPGGGTQQHQQYQSPPAADLDHPQLHQYSSIAPGNSVDPFLQLHRSVSAPPATPFLYSESREVKSKPPLQAPPQLVADAEHLRHRITAEELNFTLANVTISIGTSSRPMPAVDAVKRPPAADSDDSTGRAKRLQEMGHFLQCSVLCSDEVERKLGDQNCAVSETSAERFGVESTTTTSEVASTTGHVSDASVVQHHMQEKQQQYVVNTNIHGAGSGGGVTPPPAGCRHYNSSPIKSHQCSICHRVFSTGQALGGHKRCHWVGPAAATQVVSGRSAGAAGTVEPSVAAGEITPNLDVVGGLPCNLAAAAISATDLLYAETTTEAVNGSVVDGAKMPPSRAEISMTVMDNGIYRDSRSGGGDGQDEEELGRRRCISAHISASGDFRIRSSCGAAAGGGDIDGAAQEKEVKGTAQERDGVAGKEWETAAYVGGDVQQLDLNQLPAAMLTTQEENEH